MLFKVKFFKEKLIDIIKGDKEIVFRNSERQD